MKACAALLCLLCAPVCAAAIPTKIQTCTTTANATGANQLVGCPTKNVIWGPLSATDLVRAIKPSGAQGWIPFNTLTATTQVVPQTTGGWVAFGTLSVIVPTPAVIPPVQATHVYVLTWSAVSTRVDGTTLTDLSGYIAQTGPSLAGPWGAAVTVPTGVTTATFVLPSNVQQCFQVVAVSQGAGSSDPALVCAAAIPVAPVKPAAPANAKAS